MHPHNLVFSPVTLRKLVDLTGAASIGAEMDPSHLIEHEDASYSRLEGLSLAAGNLPGRRREKAVRRTPW